MTTSADPPVALVVDDEPSICWGFEQLLGEDGWKVIAASSAEEGLRIASAETVSLVLLDVRLPGKDGISALQEFRQATGDAAIIVMTAFGDLETAVAAIRGGASDYLTKPFRLDEALRICRQAIRQIDKQPLQDRSSSDQAAATDASVLVGRSSAMQQVFRQIALVADSELSVLITGETGTGKELAAAAIHRHSHRSDQAYIAVAPATFSETVIESELFGHVKGAFTGASSDRKGLFELADGGTVLLDEIGDLNMAAQVKLLRVIEQGEFTAVGDVRPRKCDVRVIAATNRDLHASVADGTFREDLLYRLSAVSIHLPPLRQRPDDIPLLCEYYLRRMGYAASEQAIDEGLAAELRKRDWFGNVRELRNAVEHAAVIARGRKLELDDFPPPQKRPKQSAVPCQYESLDEVIEAWATNRLQQVADQQITNLHDQLLAATEPALLRVILEHTRGNRAAAAQVLGIHRSTLRERLKRYDMD